MSNATGNASRSANALTVARPIPGQAAGRCPNRPATHIQLPLPLSDKTYRIAWSRFPGVRGGLGL